MLSREYINVGWFCAVAITVKNEVRGDTLMQGNLALGIIRKYLSSFLVITRRKLPEVFPKGHHFFPWQLYIHCAEQFHACMELYKMVPCEVYKSLIIVHSN